jgi:hypothetical protein
MNRKELGINEEGAHVKTPMTREENAFLGIIWVDHVGKENKISSEHLARAYALESAGVYADSNLKGWMRDIRHMHNHLLFEHNIPILSKAGTDGGYWVAADDAEAAEFYATFRKRGLTGLVKASRGKQSAMVDMVTQLSFEFDDLVDKTEEASAKPAHRTATPIEVVDAFLRKMTEDPELYADGLRRIGAKYGSVLIPKKRYDATLEAMKAKMIEMQSIVASLEN